MGILNVTPDSFSDGGQFTSPQHARDHAIKMVTEGVDIIDIGGESTRPGAKPVSLKEELKRIKPVIEAIRKESDCLISIDTYKASVAEVALDLGANIVNDISSLSFDQNMAHLVSKNNVPIILMHMQGSPQNMQLNTSYDNLINDLIIFFKSKIKIASEAGISNNMIILDPGIGFGKKVQDNFEIIRELKQIKAMGYPILFGPSRKSFIGEALNLPVKDRLEGTMASISAGILNGANIVRVHDIIETKRTLSVIEKIIG
ncbi:MAG: dihydropteroate synthase [Candidatus Marinimicrobia bacterium]|nr:dihydropteroate synthase [Candidatus Neomarinimicrobiota bacterium]